MIAKPPHSQFCGTRGADPDAENGLAPIRLIAMVLVSPSPENDLLYRPIDRSGVEHRGLVKDITKYGVLEPIVISRDGYILSGHRRHAAAEDAGLIEIPARVVNVSRAEDTDRFVKLLAVYNTQRVKSNDEKLREAIVQADPEEAYTALIEHREKKRFDTLTPIAMKTVRERAKISDGKQAMLDAIIGVVNKLKRFWPLSERTVHYNLLNDPPLRHSGKPGSAYANNKQSSKDLSNMATRARLFGLIPWEAIADETRPIGHWNVHREPGAFIATEVAEMFKGYWRDLLQSQPDHIEIVTEKMTLQNVINSVAAEYTISTTIGRGFSSIPPRRGMLERFEKSGKHRLVVLILSDFDPDGECIAESFARSMRDDFKVPANRIFPVQVALTAKQVKTYRLLPMMEAKKSSSRTKAFVKKHGSNVWELEALPPEELQRALREAIDQVIDVDAFNAEKASERQDAAFLEGVRRTVNTALGGIDFNAGGSLRGAER